MVDGTAAEPELLAQVTLLVGPVPAETPGERRLMAPSVFTESA